MAMNMFKKIKTKRKSAKALVFMPLLFAGFFCLFSNKAQAVSMSVGASETTIVRGKCTQISVAATAKWCRICGSGFNSGYVSAGAPNINLNTNVCPNVDTTYYVQCFYNFGNSAQFQKSTKCLDITVIQPPAVDLTANPSSINVETNPLPQNVVLSWDVSGQVTNCVKSWGGSLAGSGIGSDTEIQNSPAATYSLTCTGPGGITTKEVTVLTFCNEHTCGGGTCNTAQKSGVLDLFECRNFCSVDNDCENKKPGTWIEVAP